MVVIKPKRDFTDLDRVSYAADNSSKSRPGTAINRYRKEISQGRLVSEPGKAATSIAEYKENLCSAMGIGIGPRHHEECPFSAVNDQFASSGSASLEATIAAAYKQVFGNLGLSDSQRCVELEAQLGNGDINVRDFVAGLAKSDAYKQSYFFKVSPIRGIELNLKHLLGRPPVKQAEVSRFISLIAEHGFDALVDQITRSGEYLEVFGTDTVPYSRAFKSEAGFYCSTFVNMGQVCPGNASSDSTTQSRSLLVKAFNDARSLSNGTGGFDVAAFSYSKAVTDPSSRAFQRMYQSKTAKTWG
jgi:phycocyanin-associated rod linker protein